MSGTTTPPSATFSSATFSDAEKADVRRFCGYPPFGSGNTGNYQGYRYFQAYGLMEFRMNNMAPAEFQNIRYYLSQLYPLETAIFGASANMGTDEAAVWKRNRTETRDRENHFRSRCVVLAGLLGVPPGPLLTQPYNIQVVV